MDAHDVAGVAAGLAWDTPVTRSYRRRPEVGGECPDQGEGIVGCLDRAEGGLREQKDSGGVAAGGRRCRRPALRRRPAESRRAEPTADNVPQAAATTVPPKRLTVGTTTPPEPQPGLTVDRLQPGQKPPQFVVVSFDGSCETPEGIMRHYLDTAKAVDGRFTFNLSAVCVLPRTDAKYAYQAPDRPAGQSDIGFAVPEWVPSRITTWTEAYRAGHEIATHYVGHFCGPSGSQHLVHRAVGGRDRPVQPAAHQLAAEQPGRRRAGRAAVRPVGDQGRPDALPGGSAGPDVPAMVAAGYTHEASNHGKLTWPTRVPDYPLWDFPLQSINLAARLRRCCRWTTTSWPT